MNELDSVIIVGPKKEAFGGVSTCVKDILNSPLKSNYSFHHLQTGRDRNEPSNLLNGILRTVNQLFTLVRLNKSFLNGLIHIHTASQLSFWRYSFFIILSKILGIPIVLHIHGAEFKEFYNSSNSVFKLLIINIIESTSHLIVLSEHWRSFFDNITPLVSKTIINNSVVNKNTIKQIQSTKSYDKVKILFLGAITERKGIKDIIKAIDVIGYNDRIQYDIGGFIVEEEKALVDSLEKLSERNSSVRLHFNISEEERDKLYLLSNVFILPTYAEGLPIAMLEAMSYSLAIISTPVGAIPEVIEESKNGFLINPGDYNALSKRFEFLSKNLDQVRSIGEKNLEIARLDYSNKAMSEKIGDIYYEVLKK